MSVSKGNRVIWDWISDSVKKEVTILDSQTIVSLRIKKIVKSTLFLKVTYLDLLQSILQFGIQLAEEGKKRQGWTVEHYKKTWKKNEHGSLCSTVVFCLQSNTTNHQKHYSNMLKEKAASFLRAIGRQSERALNNTKPASYTVTFLWEKKKPLTFEKQGCIFTKHGFLLILCRWKTDVCC